MMKQGETDDLLVFAEEDGDSSILPTDQPWLVLIVDDEEEVHRLTRFVLADLTFEDRPISFLSAYSAAEGETIMRDHPEVAVVLLDVVMERDHAGLDLVRTIRQDLGNHEVRIIVRTGQPGSAPEAEVVAQYDINDYRGKSELTSLKLRTSLLMSLRNYRDIRTVVQSRQGMQRILSAGSNLFAQQTIQGFVDQVLTDLCELVGHDREACNTWGVAAIKQQDQFVIRTVKANDLSLLGQPLDTVLPTHATSLLPMVLGEKTGAFFSGGYLAYLAVEGREPHLILLTWDQLGCPLDRELIRIFMANTALAFRNLGLRQEIMETQKEIIHTLSEVVETRSTETANHVLRVGLLAGKLGELVGLSGPGIDVLRMVAPMHDVGKVGIPDAVLCKPGALTEEEREVINTHTTIGHSILSRSDRPIMKAASVVALQHHERWDGGGYPNGLEGEEIHIHARITALVDVFDALSQDRVYRRALPHDKVLEIMVAERGRAFEPVLVDQFLAHHELFQDIRDTYPDQPLQANVEA